MPLLLSISAIAMSRALRFVALAVGFALIEASNTTVGASASKPIQCHDGKGEKVDFFYAFKHPKDWTYHYMSEKMKLKEADDQMSKETSSVSETLDVFYKEAKTLTYAMWNDEPPTKSKKDAPWAHAKGILAFDGKHGFFMTHSIPKFPMPPPAKTAKSSYSDSKAPKYGQSFLCISIDKQAFTKINKLLLIDRMVVYSAKDGANTGDEAFAKWALSTDKPSSDTPDSKQDTIKSAGGQEFVVFAKSAKFGKDLYADLVAKKLGKSLIAETWQNGVGKSKSYCKGDYHVENAVDLEWPGDDDSSNWEVHQDHSKWAVAEDGTALCVGDINRQDPQHKRGGGTVCIKEKKIADQIREVVKTTEKCKSLETVLI